MKRPTSIERQHYQKFVGRSIVGIRWERLDGQALPILVLTGEDRDGNTATAAVLADPEGNDQGYLDHCL